uniref:Putative ovule protein n=1 Tax=Solanum chacoense TaxID=4108 RepID=A0A0V0HVI0_SOLCH
MLNPMTSSCDYFFNFITSFVSIYVRFFIFRKSNCLNLIKNLDMKSLIFLNEIYIFINYVKNLL